jgi:hypothetical protein
MHFINDEWWYCIPYIALLKGFYGVLQTSGYPFRSYCLQFTWLWLSGKKPEKDKSVKKSKGYIHLLKDPWKAETILNKKPTA